MKQSKVKGAESWHDWILDDLTHYDAAKREALLYRVENGEDSLTTRKGLVVQTRESLTDGSYGRVFEFQMHLKISWEITPLDYLNEMEASR